MNALLSFLRQFWYPEKATAEIKAHPGYLAGERAFERNDPRNPYREGTEAHRCWQFGYRDREHYDLKLW